MGWYFVPIANWWRPYEAMKEMWQATLQDNRHDSRESSPTSQLLLLWWGMWLASGIISIAAQNAGYGEIPVKADIVSSGCYLISGIAIIKIIKRITVRQLEYKNNSIS